MGARVEATRGSWAVPDMALHTVPWLSFATAIFHSQKPVALSLGCFSRAKWGDQSLQRVGPGPQVCRPPIIHSHCTGSLSSVNGVLPPSDGGGLHLRLPHLG